MLYNVHNNVIFRISRKKLNNVIYNKVYLYITFITHITFKLPKYLNNNHIH